MDTLPQLIGVLVSNDPKGAVEKTLSFLVTLHGARGGAVLGVEGRCARPLALLELDLTALARLGRVWERQQIGLREGAALVDEGYLVVPIRESMLLTGVLCLDAVENRPVDAWHLLALAKAIRKRCEVGAGVETGVEHYLASVTGNDVQRDQLLLALTKNQWNIKKVARLLGVTRRTIYMRMERFGIERMKVPKVLKAAGDGRVGE